MEHDNIESLLEKHLESAQYMVEVCALRLVGEPNHEEVARYTQAMAVCLEHREHLRKLLKEGM